MRPAWAPPVTSPAVRGGGTSGRRSQGLRGATMRLAKRAAGVGRLGNQTFHGRLMAAAELVAGEVLQGGEPDGWGLKSVEKGERKS